MAGSAIGGAHAAAPLRDADQHPASRPYKALPALERSAVVLEVLEHLERTDEVERLIRLVAPVVAAHHLPPGDPPHRHREGARVGLEPDVGVATGEEDSHRPLPGADLEHPLDPSWKQALHGVDAQPGVRRKRGESSGHRPVRHYGFTCRPAEHRG